MVTAWRVIVQVVVTADSTNAARNLVTDALAKEAHIVERVSVLDVTRDI